MSSSAPERAPSTFAVDVLGCKVNQHEAQQIRRALENAGLRPAPEGAAPDLVVVHTCAVTAEALRQSQQTARRARARATRVILSGCGAAGPFAANPPAEVAAIVPAGPNWIERLAAAVEAMGARGGRDPTLDRGGNLRLDRFAGHTRAFLKAQDGCDIGCSYCIVPRLRGPPRDRPAEDVVAEARALVGAGHVELVLSGVCVGQYGRDGGASLAGLIAQLTGIEGLERLRLSSLHPAELTEELLAAWRDSPRMAPHAHLPLQSGSDAVLTRMGRGYTVAEFFDALDRLRSALDRPAISTDIIVGFPGETDRDFEDTLAAAQRAGFSRIHIFRFSPRPGTRAAAMTPTVPGEVARERARRLREAAERLSAEFHRGFVGETARVLAETRSAARGEWRGYDERYIPVRFRGGAEWAGRIVPVRLESADARGARGRALAGGEKD